MANIFKSLKPSADLSRNGFDKSRFDTFSTNGGIANAVFAEEVIPDEYLEIKSYNGIQTSPLFTNNFMRAKQYVDYYFVPFTLIYRRFYQFYATRKDNHMAVYASDSVPLAVPCFCLGSLIDRMQSDMSVSYNYMQQALSLINQGPSSYAQALAAWNNANSQLDDSGQLYVFGTLRLLDMFGYGSYYIYFDVDKYTKAHTHLKSFFENMTGSVQTSPFDTLQVPTIPYEIWNQFPNLWRLAAYQYSWYCYYRNSYWDTGDFSRCFNFDDFACSTVTTSDFFQVRNGSTDVSDRMKSPFMLRCRQWKKDSLTGLMQSPQYGALSTVDVDTVVGDTFQATISDDIGRWKQYDNSDLPSGGNVSTHSQNSLQQDITHFRVKHDHKLNLFSATGTGQFDVYALRKAEMIQKWRETLLRSGNKTSDIFEGVFGKRPRYDDDDLPVFIGSVDASIQVTPVIAQANTAKSEGSSFSSNLGDIAGRSTSALKSDTIDYRNSGDFGVVIGIMTILPEAEYDALGLDKANTLTQREDYWNPMYQNLGLEGNFAFQFNNVHLDSGSRNNVIGYAPRYLHHKAAVNKVHGHFMSRGSHLIDYGSGNLSTIWKDSGGSLRYWSIPRVDVDDYISSLTYLRRLYVSPFVFDNAFIKQVDESQDSDQFYVEMYHDVKKVAPLSVLGLPRW